MALVGPGATQEQQTDVKASLDGASEYEYVTILNPLTDDFAVRVAQDIPVNMPFEIGKDRSGKTNQVTNTEKDAAQIYGLGLKNPDFQGRKHIINDTIIKAGQTINLKGNEAQVAVRQLVNEIMQREGHQRLMADPVLRKEVEDRIIRYRGPIQELMDGNIQTPRVQIDAAIKQSNEVSHDQPATGLEESPAASESGGSEATTPTASDQSSPKRVGRPPKADRS